MSGAIVGAIAGLPLSYYFQPAIVRAKIPLSEYVRAIPEIMNSEFGGNLIAGVLVCGLVGAIIGFVLDRR